MVTLLLASSLLLASAQSSVSVTTDVSGENTSVYTRITTSVNGDTTTVVSNEPGTVKVVKTDTGTTIETPAPKNSPSIINATSSPEPKSTISATPTPKKDYPFVKKDYWTALLRSLWDRISKLIRFDLLTHK